MTKEDENRIDKAAKEYGGKSPFLVSSYYIGAVAEHEYLTRQLEEKDKEIDKWRSMAKLSEQSTIGLMKQMEEQAAEIESLRKEITLKDGIISDHAESILELRKENEELKREIESLHKEQAGEDI